MHIRWKTNPPRICWKEKVGGEWKNRTASVNSSATAPAHEIPSTFIEAPFHQSSDATPNRDRDCRSAAELVKIPKVAETILSPASAAPITLRRRQVLAPLEVVASRRLRRLLHSPKLVTAWRFPTVTILM